MKRLLNLILKVVYANPKKIFLLDGLGALLTAYLLAGILTRFESIFGMPTNVLLFLASIACLYMFYSMSCYLFLKSNYQAYLRIIIIANLFYCCLTFGLVIYFYEQITALGLTYFLLEIGVVVGLVIVEKRVCDWIA